MKERSILFSSEMVRAILDGRKTQTRRVMKFQPPSEKHKLARVVDSTASNRRKMIDRLHWITYDDYNVTDSDENYFGYPYGQVGDRLWVRERHRLEAFRSAIVRVAYSDGATLECLPTVLPVTISERWRSPIHMPRWASRSTLEVTGVRVERLQEIAEADALAEGMHHGLEVYPTMLGIFQRQWEKINGKKHPWASNPWVWVIEFRTLRDDKRDDETTVAQPVQESKTTIGGGA